MVNVKADFFVLLFSTVKKDMKDEPDDRMQQFKKKAKELRILDSKTAQNLCTCCGFFFFFHFSLLQYFSNKTSSFLFNLKKSELKLFDALTHISSFCGVEMLILLLLSPIIAEPQRTVACDELKHESMSLTVRHSLLIPFSPAMIFTVCWSFALHILVRPSTEPPLHHACEVDTSSHRVLT